MPQYVQGGKLIGGSTDVNTLPDSTSAVPEGLVNMLTASDANSERHPENNCLGILCREIHDFWPWVA